MFKYEIEYFKQFTVSITKVKKSIKMFNHKNNNFLQFNTVKTRQLLYQTMHQCFKEIYVYTIH